MKSGVMARFARWVSIGGETSGPFGQTVALVQIARKAGMKLIIGYKGSMCFWHEIGLAGTPEQMKQVESAWRAAGHEVKAKKPAAAFGFDLKRPEEKWFEVEMAKRLAHGCYGGSCPECDRSS